MGGACVPGCRVLVPFGRRRMTGYVVSLRRSPPGKVRLKQIVSLIDDEPLISGVLLDLARWMSRYYVHSLGEVLRAILPAGVKGAGRLSGEDETAGIFPDEIEYPELNAEQRTACDAVGKVLSSGGTASFLLHGVTGSGKTEVYLRCIDQALKLGRSALVLIPEIALIPQTTSRFRRRFGDGVAVIHSRLTGAQRSSIWKGVSRGDIRVVIGARSSVFVPLRDLGIIVIDEEQDGSFKQEEKPHYNAKAVAEFRARNEGAVLLFGSATPSLETYVAAQKGERGYLRLSSRPVIGTMPGVDIIDMRERRGTFSVELLDALESCLENREQAIVLLNRRGHASFIQCRKCGLIERCPNCAISLTYHSRENRLLCHYCGFEEEPPGACPSCGSYGLVRKGLGTQRVEMELRNLLPGARVLRMDLDTTAGKRGHLDILERFSGGEADILLGTQMVAKGHHYPLVTLVGVISADTGLNFPDFRAAERSFQLLSQAAGRTGRGERGGRVIVQTYIPGHYLFDHLPKHDYDGFAAAELKLRKELGYPPFGRLVLLTVSSTSSGDACTGAEQVAAAVVKTCRSKRDCRVLGPAPAMIEKLRGRYRMQILIRGDLDDAERKKLVSAARAAVPGRSRAEVRWDVDPLNIS